MCVPCERYTLGSVPCGCSDYLSLMQPRAVADPSPGLHAQGSPPMPLPLSANIWGSSSQRSNHPFRQKYLLKGWLCTRLNLFKEFTIIETCGAQIFSFWCGVSLVKAPPSCDTQRSTSVSLFLRSCTNQPGIYSLEYYTAINLLLLLPYILVFTSRLR